MSGDVSERMARVCRLERRMWYFVVNNTCQIEVTAAWSDARGESVQQARDRRIEIFGVSYSRRLHGEDDGFPPCPIFPEYGISKDLKTFPNVNLKHTMALGKTG